MKYLLCHYEANIFNEISHRVRYEIILTDYEIFFFQKNVK